MQRLVLLVATAALCSCNGTPDIKGEEEIMMFADSTRTGAPMSKDPHVICFKDRFLLYYSMPPAKNPKDDDITGWTIGIAASTDLTHWEKVGEVRPEPLSELEQKGFCAPCARVIDGKVSILPILWELGAGCHLPRDIRRRHQFYRRFEQPYLLPGQVRLDLRQGH